MSKEPKDIRELLADCMYAIEEWQSTIAGTPTELHIDQLNDIYKKSELNIRRRIVWESGAKYSDALEVRNGTELPSEPPTSQKASQIKPLNRRVK